jgi:hypothetical protein
MISDSIVRHYDEEINVLVDIECQINFCILLKTSLNVHNKTHSFHIAVF